MPNAFASAIARSDVGFLVPASQLKDILVIGVLSGQALSAFNAWRNPAATFDMVTGAAIATVQLTRYRSIYLPTGGGETGGGATCADIAAFGQRAADVATYVNVYGGSITALTQQ